MAVYFDGIIDSHTRATAEQARQFESDPHAYERKAKARFFLEYCDEYRWTYPALPKQGVLTRWNVHRAHIAHSLWMRENEGTDFGSCR
jgi:hypothetical protein